MKNAHHPGPESLISCSAGSMPEAFAAVMSCHIERCAECRTELGLLETVGTALFDKIEPTPVSRSAPVMSLRRLEADVLEPRVTRNVADGDVPGPLVAVLGTDLDAVKWKRVSPGVWQYVIELTNENRGDLRLIKVAPGQALPEHAHNGSELTLILRGSYRDANGHFIVGDVSDMCGDAAHSPVADPIEGCICLIATEGKLKFKGVVARLVQPFTGF